MTISKKAAQATTQQKPQRGASRAQLEYRAKLHGIAACGCVRPEEQGHTRVCSMHGEVLARVEQW